MWKKIKEIPPFITSIIAILAAVIAVTTWVFGYFATRSELEKVRCWSEINIKINSKQIDQTILLADNFRMKSCIQILERKKESESLTNFERETLKEYEDLCKSNDKDIKEIKAETERLLEIVRSGTVVESDGHCKE